MTLHAFLAALGRWTDGSGPAYRRLAQAIRAAVERGDQHLVLIRRTDGDVERTALERVRFVPLTSVSRPAPGDRSA